MPTTIDRQQKSGTQRKAWTMSSNAISGTQHCWVNSYAMRKQEKYKKRWSVGLLMMLPAGRQCVNLACTNLLSIDNLCLLPALHGSSGTTTNQLPLFLKRYGHSQHTRAVPAIVRRWGKKVNMFGHIIFPSLLKLLRHNGSQESLKYLHWHQSVFWSYTQYWPRLNM